VITGCRWCDTPRGPRWASKSAAHRWLQRGQADGTWAAMQARVLELAQAIWGKLKPGEPFRYRSDEPFKYDVQRRVPDVSKAKRVLGFECTTPLDTMLDEVVPWVKHQVELGNI